MKILVIGTAGEGKSAIASLIERHLTLNGIKTKVIDDGTEQYLGTPEMVKKLHAIAARDDFEIVVETKQASREAYKL